MGVFSFFFSLLSCSFFFVRFSNTCVYAHVDSTLTCSFFFPCAYVGAAGFMAVHSGRALHPRQCEFSTVL